MKKLIRQIMERSYRATFNISWKIRVYTFIIYNTVIAQNLFNTNMVLWYVNLTSIWMKAASF